MKLPTSITVNAVSIVVALSLCGCASQNTRKSDKAVIKGKRVLFIGDSVTDGGWGNSGGGSQPSEERNHWDQNHIFGHSYMMLCASWYLSEYPEREYVFLNRGISGNDLDALAARWQKDVIDEHPDVLSVLIGTNDVHYQVERVERSSRSGRPAPPFDFDRWDREYRSLLDSALAHNPRLRILLATPFTAKVGNVGRSASFQLRDSLINKVCDITRAIARDYDATLVPYDSLFKALPLQYPEQGVSYWSWDGIHPTPAGHRRMADLWIERFGE